MPLSSILQIAQLRFLYFLIKGNHQKANVSLIDHS